MTLAERIAQLQTALPFLKRTGATAAHGQNILNVASANVRSAVASFGQGRMARLGTPQPGYFTPPVQGFSATTTSGRAPHPTPAAQLTPALLGRGFGSIQSRQTP